jgi:hypothetical protein
MGHFFEYQLNRGRVGEKAAGLWLRQINPERWICPQRFAKEGPIELGCMLNEWKNYPEWEYKEGYNPNKDYIQHIGNEFTLAHEIKTDYEAYNSTGQGKYKTGNFFVEVDAGCIENIWKLDKAKGFRNIKSGVGWFNTAIGCHASWYHYFFPMCDYDGQGKKLNESREKGIIRLTPDEITRFFEEKSIPTGSKIVIEAPFWYFLSMTCDKLRDILREFAGVRFSDNPEKTALKANFAIPIFPVIQKMIYDAAHGEYDGRIFLSPICEYAQKGDDFGGKFYMHQRMKEELRPRLEDIDKMTLEELDGMTLKEIELIQRKSISQYIIRGKYQEPFSTLAFSATLPTYYPGKRIGS